MSLLYRVRLLLAQFTAYVACQGAWREHDRGHGARNRFHPANLWGVSTYLRRIWGWSAPRGGGASPVGLRLEGRACAVLLSYSRPWNIPGLVESLLASESVGRVKVSNNNPADEGWLRRWVRPDPRVEVIHRDRRTKQGVRVEMAASVAEEVAVLVDDDILLTPAQVDLLVAKCLLDPNRCHGFTGEISTDGCESPDLRGGTVHAGYPFRMAVRTDGEAEVDHLTNVYVLAPSLARAAMETYLAAGMGSLEDFGNGEDILMSMASPGRPKIHDIGEVLACVSGNDPTVATWAGTNDFFGERLRLHRGLRRP
jgi:hypothetical protein